MPQETILSILPNADDRHRLVVVLCYETDSRIELRQQSFGDGVGWYTQSSVTLEPEQLRQLKSVLGGTSSSRDLAKPVRQGFRPRVVHAESA